jgi:phosphoribosylformylglycinamidine cyclo-ligase
MGHRFEIYLPGEYAQDVISCAKGYGVDAQIIGRCQSSETKKLEIISDAGHFEYTGA